MKIDYTGIEKQLRTELKSSLFYMLRIIDHATFFYQFEESYKKAELIDKFLERKHLWYKLQGCQPYKQFFTI